MNFLLNLKNKVSVVQWIKQFRPKEKLEVRILSEAPGLVFN